MLLGHFGMASGATLGDGDTYFNTTMAQTGTRNNQAVGVAGRP